MRDIDELVTIGVRFPPGSHAELVLDADRRDATHHALHAAHPDVEIAVLATCNRTELLLSGLSPASAIAAWHTALGPSSPTAFCLDQPAEPYVHTGLDAVDHLCRVTCGLDSAILGEPEIASQVRAALHRSEQLGTAGIALRRAFRVAFAASKAVRATTPLAARPPGIGALAAQWLTARRPRSHVAVLGTGTAAKSVGRQLTRNDHRVTLFGRDEERCAYLAATIGVEHEALASLPAILGRLDAVVLAVPGPNPQLEATLSEPLRRGTFVIDLGAPANVTGAPSAQLVTLRQLAASRPTPAHPQPADPEAEAAIRHVIDRSQRPEPTQWQGQGPGSPTRSAGPRTPVPV